MSPDARITRLATELLTLDHWAASILGQGGEKDRSRTLPPPRQLAGHLMTPRGSDCELTDLRHVCAEGLKLYTLWYCTPLLTREALEPEVLAELNISLTEAERCWSALCGEPQTLEALLATLHRQPQAAD